jgi:hypothetical protein
MYIACVFQYNNNIIMKMEGQPLIYNKNYLNLILIQITIKVR